MSVARRIFLTLVALAAGTAAIVALSVPGALGAYSAKVTNAADAVATNPWFTCGAAATGDNAAIAYAMDDTQNIIPIFQTTLTDDSGNGRNGLYTLLGVSYRQPGPCPRDGGFAATFNGVNGYAYGPNATYTAATFSEEIWFRTGTGGGKLLGFGNLRTTISTQFDRSIYLTNAGNVAFGVNPGTWKVITSPGTYLDNTWHHVVATQGLATDANPGIRLYVDGALVASDASVVTNSGTAGYLRLAYDTLTGVGATQPTNFAFTGSLAWAAYYPTAVLTPAQVKAHYAAGRG